MDIRRQRSDELKDELAKDGGMKDDSINDLELSDVEAKHVRKIYRRLDLRIIPAFWVLYFLCSAVCSSKKYRRIGLICYIA
jgi:hypothetical protein